MSWFEEQIRQRKQTDQTLFEDSILRMASVVLGKGRSRAMEDLRLLTQAAVDTILHYYRCKPVEVPESVTDPKEAMEYSLRPYGIAHREVRLEQGWYRDAFGAMLAFRKEDGVPVALIPRPFRGYWYYDPVSGKKDRVTAGTADLFQPDAVAFYRPLPQKKLGISDLILYMKSCLSGGDLVFLLVLTLLATGVGMLTPALTHVLTGFVLESGSGTLLVGAAVFLAAAAISAMLIEAVRGLGMARVETKVSLSVEAAMMVRLMNLPPRFFRGFSSGELSSRFSTMNQLCTLLLGNVFSLGLTSLASLLYITQIFRYAPALVAPALVVILVTVGVAGISALMQMRVTRKALKLSARENGVSYALISGVQKIKLAGAEKRAFSRWANAYAQAAELVYDPPLLLKISSVLTTAVSLAGTVVLYYIAVKTAVTPSEYISFNAAYGMVMGAFTSLSGVALTVAQIKPILEMVEPILKTEPETTTGKTMVTNLSGGIELSNVCFRYTDTMPYVLDGLSLKIKPGEYVAVVGTTGCGKSTLMRLLLGFETPERGAVYYDGRDLSKLDHRSLRSRIGAVTQDGSLFQGDIYSNIVVSAPTLTLEDAWAAAELAGMAEDIRAMPMGMHTVISEGQGGISGGQKQRLMIARAVAPKPKILLFDEATSALDNKTQSQVSQALDGLKCTRIVIAHRLSTIRHCDRILVLDKGRIVEEGTYDALIAQNGLFAELVARQRLDLSAEQGKDVAKGKKQ